VAVQADTQVLPYEDVHTIIEKAKTLAVTKCTCRLTAHKCDRPLEACLQVNKAAAYSIDRGNRPGNQQSRGPGDPAPGGRGRVDPCDHEQTPGGSFHLQLLPLLLSDHADPDPGGIRVIDPSRFQARLIRPGAPPAGLVWNAAISGPADR